MRYTASQIQGVRNLIDHHGITLEISDDAAVQFLDWYLPFSRRGTILEAAREVESECNVYLAAKKYWLNQKEIATTIRSDT